MNTADVVVMQGSNSQRRVIRVTRLIVASQRRPSLFWVALSLSKFLVVRWSFFGKNHWSKGESTGGAVLSGKGKQKVQWILHF